MACGEYVIQSGQFTLVQSFVRHWKVRPWRILRNVCHQSCGGIDESLNMLKSDGVCEGKRDDTMATIEKSIRRDGSF